MIDRATIASRLDTKTQWPEIEREAARAESFVGDCEIVRASALDYGDAQFFAKLAYQRAFLGQVFYIRGTAAKDCRDLIAQAVNDFLTALELNYPTEAAEVNNWFYRSLVVNDISSAHFIAALPYEVWPYGDDFLRFQATWGFSLLRGEEQDASEDLEYLSALCADAEVELTDDEDDRRRALLENNSCQLMQAIFRRDSRAAGEFMRERSQLRPLVPVEGIRYEPYQPLDLIGLGLWQLASRRRMTLELTEFSLPIDLCNAC